MKNLNRNGFFDVLTNGSGLFRSIFKKPIFYVIFFYWICVSGLIRAYQVHYSYKVTSNMKSIELGESTLNQIFSLFSKEILLLVGSYIWGFILIWVGIFLLVDNMKQSQETLLSQISATFLKPGAFLKSIFILASFLVPALTLSFLVVPSLIFIAMALVALVLVCLKPSLSPGQLLIYSFRLSKLPKKPGVFFRLLDLTTLSLFFMIMIEWIAFKNPILVKELQPAGSIDFLNRFLISSSVHGVSLWLLSTILFYLLLTHYLCCIYIFSKRI